MNPTITDQDDAELGAHIRQTLFAVADTIQATDESIVHETKPTASTARRVAKRGLAIAAALVMMSLGFVGWKALGEGDIERIPTEAALIGGTAEGYEWWLIPSEAIVGHGNPCDVPFPGVEMVSVATNRPGEQWNTGGVNYGLHNPAGTNTPIDGQSGVFTYDCSNPRSDFDEAAWLPDPTLHEVGFMRLGRDNDSDSPWGVFAATHPSIDHIELVVDGQAVDTFATATKLDEPDGPRYGGFAIASDVCTFTLNYLNDGQTITSDQRTFC